MRKPRPPTPLEKLGRVQRSLRERYDELLWLRQRVKFNKPKTAASPQAEGRLVTMASAAAAALIKSR